MKKKLEKAIESLARASLKFITIGNYYAILPNNPREREGENVSLA